MPNHSEKVFIALNKFMGENASEGMTDEEYKELTRRFMNEYNSRLHEDVTEENAETSDDYMELAEVARKKSDRLRYAQKALELAPDNFDAEAMVIELSAAGYFDRLQKLEKAVIRATAVMKKNGYMDVENIGKFWLITETRPYMRLRTNYAITLVGCGMYRKAITELEELLRLCTNDNPGNRYLLIHLYTLLEMEQEALILYDKYGDYGDTQLLLPMSVLYYKLGDFDKAEKYLKKLAEINKDTKKFIRSVIKGEIYDYMGYMNSYRPCTIEELEIEYENYPFLFSLVPVYFEWADEKLKQKRKRSS